MTAPSFKTDAPKGGAIKHIHFGYPALFKASFVDPKGAVASYTFSAPFAMFNYLSTTALRATFSHTNKKVIKNIKKRQ